MPTQAVRHRWSADPTADARPRPAPAGRLAAGPARALGGRAGNMGWFVIGTVAAAFQIALAIPVLAVGHGWLGVAMALVWGAATLFAAWAWLFGRWWILIAPIVTFAALIVASALGG